jgi:PAS domain S-box-containing protein
LSWTQTPVVQAVLGREGVFEGEDYRGVPVLSVAKVVPQSSWALVAKLDMEEALAEWRLRSILLLASLAGGGLSVTIAFWVLWEKTSKAGLKRQLALEREKREGETRYRTTLMSIGDGVIVTDARGRVQLLNAVAESLTGWSEKDARGKPMEEVFHIVNQDTRRLVDNPVREVMEKGVIVGLANHTVLISRNGAEFPIADSAAPIQGDGGGIVGVVLVFRDQSQEYAAQSALMTSESKFRDLFDNMLEGFTVREVLLDAEGRPTDYRFHKINNAYERLTGLKAEDIVGRCGREVFSELEPFWIERYGEVALTGEPARFVGYHRMLDKHFEVFSYRTKEGRVASVIRDISERIRADEERDHLRAQLSQAQKMESVGRLAGGVAHDFNNMLGVILGNTELAMSEIDPLNPAYENLDEISKAAKRSADITRQLLAFARKQTVAPKVIDLNENLESMLKMIRRLIGEDIDLCWLPCADLWKIRIDPTQVDQILANLATNARDAISGVGRLTIETANVTLDQPYCETHPGFVPGDYAVLSVSDDGCGIEREQLSSIFEPFFTTKEMGKGTGLGLATVYGIVKQNGGFVHVYSEPGHGATFRIYLPRAEAQPGANRPEISESQGGTETVLVVEDEESNLKLCTRILASFGYRVLAANSPDQALELAEEYKDEIDLLLTDVVMPTMNGRELAERLCEAQPGLRCIFMSGYTAEVVSHRGVLEEGMNFIHKPFSRLDLDATIREVLDG